MQVIEIYGTICRTVSIYFTSTNSMSFSGQTVSPELGFRWKIAQFVKKKVLLLVPKMWHSSLMLSQQMVFAILHSVFIRRSSHSMPALHILSYNYAFH